MAKKAGEGSAPRMPYEAILSVDERGSDMVMYVSLSLPCSKAEGAGAQLSFFFSWLESEFQTGYHSYARSALQVAFQLCHDLLFWDESEGAPL